MFRGAHDVWQSFCETIVARSQFPKRQSQRNHHRRPHKKTYGALEVLEDRTLLAAPLDSNWQRLDPSGSLIFQQDYLGHLTNTIDVFAEDFEAGSLGSNWLTASSTADGRVGVSSVLGTPAHGGSFHLAMDNAVVANNLNEAILTVDLSSVNDAELSFWHKDVNDEDNPLPAQFAGSFNGDGVSISEDGTTWHTLTSLNNSNSPNNVYTQFTFDLEQAASDAGIALGSQFQIKFQQFDNFPFATDGRTFDDILVRGTVAGPDSTTVFLEGGQTLTVVATPADPAATLTASIYDSSDTLLASVTAPGAGLAVDLQAVAIAGDDDYRVEITGDVPADFDLSLYRNAVVEVVDSSDGSELDATGSFVSLGSGRYGIVGRFGDSNNDGGPLQSGPIFTTQADGTRLGSIDTATGAGTDIGPFGTTQTWAAAFDTDGTLFTLINGFTGNAVLATVDQSTGAATTVGSGIGTNMISLEVATDGRMYGIGYNDRILYEINKATGLANPIGDTGITANMDLAFDSAGVMYATVGNRIWTVDPTSGTSTLLGSFSGILSGSVMGIMFDETDTLFATAHVPDSPLYQIDLSTLSATVIGGTNFFLPHGGDIFISTGVAEPTDVIVNGSFETGDFTGWTTVTTAGPFRPWLVTGGGQGGGFGMATTDPQEGNFVAWNGFDGGGPMEFQLYQDVAIDAVGTATLTWMDRVQWNFTVGSTATLPRLYDVEIRDPSTNAVLETVYSFSTGTQATDPTGDTGWQSHSVDLSAFAGETVRVFFREQIPQAGTGPGQIEFDDISLVVGDTAISETMYAAIGRGSSINPGGLLVVDPSTGAGTLVGDPVTPGGLTGLDFDSSGRLWGSSIDGPSGNRVSGLVEIDPDTGVLISTIPITVNGTPISIGDLAIQPGTNRIFGVHSNSDNTGPGGQIYTIDRATGAATLVGDTNQGRNGGLAFASDGTLYFMDFDELHELDPNTATVLSTISLDFGSHDGLGIRSSDGTLFATRAGAGTFGDEIRLIDPATGTSTLIGQTGNGNASDLAFRVSSPESDIDVDEYVLDLTGSAGHQIDIVFSTDTGGPVVEELDLGIFLSDDPTTAPVAELQSTGLFDSITVGDLRQSTPVLSDLLEFETLLVYTNSIPANAIVLGNVLADYVDAGGHLVLGTYGFSDPWDIEGRITAPGYAPLTNVGVNGSVSGSLVPVIPGDPLFDGIDVNAISYFQNGNFAHAGVDAGATLLATDGAGHNMIARNAAGNVIGVNFFPKGAITANNQELFDLLGNALRVNSTSTSTGAFTLELLDTDGTTVLATGTTGASNFGLGILDFTVPADGSYTLRVSGQSGRYGITVTDDLVFDTEPNDSSSQFLRNLDPVDGALGFIGSSLVGDRYSITLTAGDTVGFRTTTPFDSLVDGVNLLDPNLEVLDSDGNTVAFDSDTADGKNAFVTLTPAQSGVYTVIVGADTGSGAGEYVLSAFNVNDAPVITSATLDNAEIDENDSVTLTVQFVDPDPGDSQTIEVTWGDGETSTLTVAGSGTYAFTHQYLDDGPYPGNGTAFDTYAVSVSVTDLAGESDTRTNSSAQELLVNGSFETGDFTGWTTVMTAGPFRPWLVTGGGQGGGFGMATTDPQEGNFVAWNGFDGGGPMEFQLYQDVAIDAVGTATLTWMDRVQWNFTVGSAATLPRLYDVEIRDPSTNAVLETVYSFSTGTQATDPTGDTGWQSHSVDLSAFAGETVRVFFREQIPQVATGPGQIEFDDIRLTAFEPLTVTVENVAPVITGLSLSDTVIDENGSITLSGSFDDPGRFDVHEIVIDWGDGTSETVSVAVGDRTFSASHQFLDDGSSPGNGTTSDVYSIGVTISDDDTGVGSGSTDLTVENVEPTITSFVDPAPASNKGNENSPVTLALDFSDHGTLDVHSVLIDWGDGSSETIVIPLGDRSLSIDHSYASGGLYDIDVTVSDDDSGSDQFSTTAFITGVGVLNVNGENVLYIIGTAEDDHVTVNQQGNGQLRVHASFIDDPGGRTFALVDVDRIVSFLCEGDDHLNLAGNISLPSLIDAGSGSDHVNGGRGNDIILGRDGDDHLNGGGGHDILIGGEGVDRLVGGSDSDLLFGGVFASTTDLGGNPLSSFLDDRDDLLAIQSIWIDDDHDIADRIADIGSLDNFFTKLFDDDEDDRLTGSSDADWFLVFGGDTVTGAKGKKSSDLVQQL